MIQPSYERPENAPGDSGNLAANKESSEAAVRRFFRAYCHNPEVARAILAAAGSIEGLQSDVARVNKREAEQGFSDTSDFAELTRSAAALYAGAILMETEYPPNLGSVTLGAHLPDGFGSHSVVDLEATPWYVRPDFQANADLPPAA